MTISQVPNIVRVTFRYDLFKGTAPADVAEWGVCFLASSVPTDSAIIDAVLQDMSHAAAASHKVNIDPTIYTSHVKLNQVRVALEATNGHTLFEKITPGFTPYDWEGTAGGVQLPWQTSLVISLYAYPPGEFKANGKSFRGRFYTPPLSSSVIAGDGSGGLSLGTASSIAGMYAQVLKELQEHDYTGFPAFAPKLVVNSRRYTMTNLVQSVRVDTKLDTQRRRTNREIAEVGVAAFPS